MEAKTNIGIHRVFHRLEFGHCFNLILKKPLPLCVQDILFPRYFSNKFHCVKEIDTMVIIFQFLH